MKKNLKILLPILFFTLILSDLIFSQTRIAVYYSDQTEKLDPIKSTQVINHITFLELLFMQDKIPYKVIYGNDLEDGIEDDFDLLILPSVDIISEEELESINSFINLGKSVFIIKSKLEIYSDSKYPLHSDVQGFSGFSYDETGSQNLSAFQFFDSDLILNDDLNQHGILLTLKNKILISDYSKSILQSAGELKLPAEKENCSSVFIGKLNAGKLAWLGFDQDDIIGGKQDESLYKKLILEIIDYLDVEVDIRIKTLPENFKSYKLITLRYNSFLEPELIDKLHLDGFTPHLIISLDTKIQENIRGKFNDEDLILDLTNLNFEKMSAQQFYDTLNYFSEISGIKIENIIMNSNYLTDTIIEKLRMFDVKTILLNSDYSGLPQKISNEIISVPFEIAPSKSRTYSFINYTPSVKCTENPEDDLLLAISKIDKTENWMTNLNSLRDWWIKRSKIQVQFSNQEDGLYRISLKNNNYSPINDVSVIINLPTSIDLNLLTISDGRNFIDYQIDNKSGIVSFNVQILQSQETKTYLISTN